MVNAIEVYQHVGKLLDKLDNNIHISRIIIVTNYCVRVYGENNTCIAFIGWGGEVCLF